MNVSTFSGITPIEFGSSIFYVIRSHLKIFQAPQLQPNWTYPISRNNYHSNCRFKQGSHRPLFHRNHSMAFTTHEQTHQELRQTQFSAMKIYENQQVAPQTTWAQRHLCSLSLSPIVFDLSVSARRPSSSANSDYPSTANQSGSFDPQRIYLEMHRYKPPQSR